MNNDRPTQKMEESNPFPLKIPVIADYRPIRVIGTGSFGQVWIALDATGSPCALKIIHKGTFDDEVFWKEFEGVKNYLPISRSNMGLVTILHVGKDPQEKFYYYTMELADNANDSIGDDWKEYEALSLSLQINRIQMLYPLDKFEEIAINLADGLAHLHENGLVHRDIKPSNVIFINGKAKLADVGLVTKGVEASTFIGTAGYIPPEGPGMPAADVYALGKTLYELLTGKGMQSFPELPTLIPTSGKTKLFSSYNFIITRSCEPNHNKRIKDGNELLLMLQEFGQKKNSVVQKPRRYFPWVVPIGLSCLIATVLDYKYFKIYTSALIEWVEHVLPEKTPNFTHGAINSESNNTVLNSGSNVSPNNSNNTIADFFLPSISGRSDAKSEKDLNGDRLLPRISHFSTGVEDSARREGVFAQQPIVKESVEIPPGRIFEWSEMELRMPWIPKGSYQMGSPEDESKRDLDESPRSLKTINDGFWLGSNEVSQSLYYRFTKKNPSKFTSNVRNPVENVSYHDANYFCILITESAHLLGVIPRNYNFQLPTEVEWEYACRSGTQTPFAFGDSLTGLNANFKDIQNSSKPIDLTSTTPVGSYSPNWWGLYDMHGNVAEWTSTVYHDYAITPRYQSVSHNKNIQLVVRGGAWNNFSKFCRSAYRNKFSPSFSSSGVGFRVTLKPL